MNSAQTQVTTNATMQSPRAVSARLSRVSHAAMLLLASGVVALTLILPASAHAAPAERGARQPLIATHQSSLIPVEQSFMGAVFIQRLCNDIRLVDTGSTPRPEASCVAPPATILTYKRSMGRWVVSRINRQRAGDVIALTKQYSGEWMWIYAPTLGLRVIPRVELARMR